LDWFFVLFVPSFGFFVSSFSLFSACFQGSRVRCAYPGYFLFLKIFNLR